jgi:hypothetical protein
LSLFAQTITCSALFQGFYFHVAHAREKRSNVLCHGWGSNSIELVCANYHMFCFISGFLLSCCPCKGEKKQCFVSRMGFQLNRACLRKRSHVLLYFRFFTFMSPMQRKKEAMLCVSDGVPTQ